MTVSKTLKGILSPLVCLVKVFTVKTVSILVLVTVLFGILILNKKQDNKIKINIIPFFIILFL
jgi:hypothetical protein